ncbi:ABC-type lipoprotein export system ATPase subunit [Bradyrhizobium ottawaense]|uniref:ABC-type lipoprotein export system ATPase subunit n=1 Tax=Bradyrhizobium ottawaense TaxID=931866 RepID=A0ABV4G733_9BRAD
MIPHLADPIIAIEKVRREFMAGDTSVVALDDFSLSIQPGEMVAIIGSSGSGKSTLLNILGCLDRPTSGTYRVAGKNVSELDADALAALRREHFGFIFQRYHLLGDLSAGENVEIPAIYAGMKARERRTRAEQLLARLGVNDRRGHRPNQLSGGQQQRVSIARALINGAEVILGGRAHRRARPAQRRGGPEDPERAAPRGADDHHRHPRCRCRRAGRTHHRAARRQDRLRSPRGDDKRVGAGGSGVADVMEQRHRLVRRLAAPAGGLADGAGCDGRAPAARLPDHARHHHRHRRGVVGGRARQRVPAQGAVRHFEPRHQHDRGISGQGLWRRPRRQDQDAGTGRRPRARPAGFHCRGHSDGVDQHDGAISRQRVQRAGERRRRELFPGQGRQARERTPVRYRCDPQHRAAGRHRRQYPQDLLRRRPDLRDRPRDLARQGALSHRRRHRPAAGRVRLEPEPVGLPALHHRAGPVHGRSRAAQHPAADQRRGFDRAGAGRGDHALDAAAATPGISSSSTPTISAAPSPARHRRWRSWWRRSR